MDALGCLVALLLRVFLRAVGLGRALARRVEVVTPANDLRQVQEGLQWLRLRLPPYAGSNYHLPPLLLPLASAAARAPLLAALAPAAVDVAAACLLHRVARLATRPRAAPAARPLKPAETGVARLQLLAGQAYLWHPFAIASCVAGTLTTYESALLLAALLGALRGNAPLAGLSLAGAAYLGLHPVLLLVPLGMLLAGGPEDLTLRLPPPSAPSQPPPKPAPSSDGPSSHPIPTDDLHSAPNTPHAPPVPTPFAPSTSHTPTPQATPPAGPSAAATAGAVLELAAWFAAGALALGVLSDVALQRHPQHMCLLPHLPPALLGAVWPAGAATAAVGPGGEGAGPGSGGGCWVRGTYGWLLAATDHTPNIGFFWYFFQEMFPNFRTFFKFVFHSHAAFFSLPLAVLLPHRPLFLAFAQLLTTAMFKPYPSTGDLALYTSLLPLFAAQLARSGYVLFLANSALLLAVLAPAMWWQWIAVDSANANFFYSITLLLGLWQTTLFTHLLSLTLRLDREQQAEAAAVEGQQE